MGRFILIRTPIKRIPTTWNPSDKHASVTLSNGNLTAAVSVGDDGAVRSVQGVTSGKWYWEVTAQGANQREIIGVMNSSANLAAFIGNDANGWSYFGFDGKKINNNVQTAYGAAYTTGDVISVLLDRDAGTLTFWKNGVSQGQAFSGLTGTLYAAFSGASTVLSEQATVNFGQSPFVYSPPAGYMHGLCVHA